MSSSIVTLMTAIQTVQASVPTPTGRKALVIPADIQPPPSLTPPMFVNELSYLHLPEGDFSGRTFGNKKRHNEWIILMHLCFAPFDPKYEIREQWDWTDPILDTFDNNATLSAVCDSSKILDVDFKPFDYGPQRWICSTFPLHITVVGP